MFDYILQGEYVVKYILQDIHIYIYIQNHNFMKSKLLTILGVFCIYLAFLFLIFANLSLSEKYDTEFTNLEKELCGNGFYLEIIYSGEAYRCTTDQINEYIIFDRIQ